METIWAINVEARSLVYDYRMIFYIRGKKMKKNIRQGIWLIIKKPHPSLC